MLRRTPLSHSAACTLGNPRAGSLLAVVISLLVLRTAVLGLQGPDVTDIFRRIGSRKPTLVGLEPLAILIRAVC
jgi:hypothetical protein